MSRSHVNEEQGEHSRKRTECTRPGAKRDIVYSRSYVQFHVAGVEHEMNLEPKESIALWGDLVGSARSLGSKGRVSGES